MPTTQNSGNNSGQQNIVPHQFKPGQSGNPGGRPRKQLVSHHLIEQMDRPIPDSMKTDLPEDFMELYGEEATYGQLMAYKLVTQALKGNMRALREILDRVEGKVTQKMEVNGDLSIADRLQRARQRRETLRENANGNPD